MNQEEQLRSEGFVEVHRVRNEWEGNLLVGYLGDNGVEATLQLPPQIPPLDAVTAGFSGTDKVCGIFVLQHDADRAAALVKEFLSAATDESTLEQAATQNPPVDRETE